MRANPAAPVDLVEEPVHDHEQHQDCEQSGCGLQVESRNAFTELAYESSGDEPGGQRGDESESGTGPNGAPMGLGRTGHAGGDSGKDQDAFQAFTKNQNADVYGGDCCTRLWSQWVRISVFAKSLPHHDSQNSD